MRLIHVYNLELRGVVDPPPYAILSHRWTNKELSYQAYHGCINQDSPTSRKVLNFCKAIRAANTTRQDGEPLLEWAWVDTCCIDKASSSELSEAINSMWSWYEKSASCYAYLVDVPWCENRAELLANFRESNWFRRGWTLQELLAPKKVIFYTSDWQIIGFSPGSNLQDVEMLEALCTASGIDLPYISHAQSIFSACVAEKMSWASGRTTTRSEDTAYCLLGIFGVHMPLLYGEGEDAFIRLQQEIIRQSNDESIFARRLPASGKSHFTQSFAQGARSGLLACHPAEFAGCANIRVVDRVPRRPFQVTQKGLDLHGPAVEIESCYNDRGSRFTRRRVPHRIELCIFAGPQSGRLRDASKAETGGRLLAGLARDRTQ
ncbi:Vegetative incompatibility protein HET-E-1 [Fulvia fulva]|uniref:Vegetative incompatibility protein HET-E-1 n=1 Tax=Passalora fulva TaxID=5499 RepID=A0A9Q8PEL7_PASFU|nr:Vegetative incompatibility protein HET-E-1 [Fulvia fulva]KAK4618071.1 Vegetative incompatibility protein HET-E-1 [Fulvia fulva]KAK4619211.1 Vegetative incompatibility protein HET-E-1 [Fulvia fulva]UJO21002.1 Vegetative incompatibility protein HET-E-1 [Fulvia fulva]WPV18027.1 Vegetative incompatibility protein HET-E-1 [Fulvia fulva]WPV33173.1 Vegetative incompatibility protein HET-E-1 [Fulvia fulva]